MAAGTQNASGKVDLELKQAFQEFQNNMVETHQKLRLADFQIELQKQRMKRATLAKSELLTLPDTTPSYQSVGRMFIKQAMKETLDELDRRVEDGQAKITNIENHKTYLNRSLVDAQSNLREMVQAKKSGSVAM